MRSAPRPWPGAGAHSFRARRWRPCATAEQPPRGRGSRGLAPNPYGTEEWRLGILHAPFTSSWDVRRATITNGSPDRLRLISGVPSSFLAGSVNREPAILTRTEMPESDSRPGTGPAQPSWRGAHRQCTRNGVHGAPPLHFVRRKVKRTVARRSHAIHIDLLQSRQRPPAPPWGRLGGGPANLARTQCSGLVSRAGLPAGALPPLRKAFPASYPVPWDSRHQCRRSRHPPSRREATSRVGQKPGIRWRRRHRDRWPSHLPGGPLCPSDPRGLQRPEQRPPGTCGVPRQGGGRAIERGRPRDTATPRPWNRGVHIPGRRMAKFRRHRSDAAVSNRAQETRLVEVTA